MDFPSSWQSSHRLPVMTRKRLPGRRPNQTIDVEFDGVSYAICIGFYADNGHPAEIFSAGALADLLAEHAPEADGTMAGRNAE